MKRILLISALIILALNFSSAQTFQLVGNYAFKEGEKLSYDVKYGFLKAAEADIEVFPTNKTFHNRSAYHVVVKGKTTGFFRTLYKIDDVYESYIDKYALIPWRFDENIKEGNYRRKAQTHFDHFKNTAVCKDKVTPIPTGTQDMVSAMYYARSLRLDTMKKNDRVAMQFFLQDSVYDVAFSFVRREKIEVDAGTFNCIVLSLDLVEGSFFPKDGEALLWVSDDKNRIPIQMKVDIYVGAMYLELTKYSGLKHK